MAALYNLLLWFFENKHANVAQTKSPRQPVTCDRRLLQWEGMPLHFGVYWGVRIFHRWVQYDQLIEWPDGEHLSNPYFPFHELLFSRNWQPSPPACNTKINVDIYTWQGHHFICLQTLLAYMVST